MTWLGYLSHHGHNESMPNEPVPTDDHRIVFVDVDGTLTDHIDGVPDSAIAAIRTARERGHLVLLCTGRAYGDVPEEVLAIGFDGAVTNGGGTVMFEDEVLLDQTFSVDDAKRMLEYLDDNDLEYIAQTTGLTHRSRNYVAVLEAYSAVLAEKGNPFDFAEIIDWLATMPLIDDVPTETITKTAFVGLDPNTVTKARSELGDSYYVVNGSIPTPVGVSGEISPGGVSKGAGIRLLLDHLDLNADQAIGIGDSYNDVEMFEVCGTSVAMGNAEPEVRQLADRVTTTVGEDGVALALQSLGLVDSI